MRSYSYALIVLALTCPRPAEACCVNGPCPETARWRTLRLLNEEILPRDGILLFSGLTDNRQCTDALDPSIKIEVRRGETPIAGAIQLADGRGSNFIWRPATPWEPGSYHLHVEIDNDAIGPSTDSQEELVCPPDCPDPSIALLDADFAVGPGFSPPIPALPVPQLSLAVSRFEQKMTDITCCPGVEPSTECGPTWETSQCASIYEQHRMALEVPPHIIPPELSFQLLYELRADGEAIARAFEPDRLAQPDGRVSPACVQLVALHLGTGDTLTSETICPPDQLAGDLGVHPVDVEAELACPDPVLCGTGDLEWDPDACTSYDPLTLPPPPLLQDPAFDPPCPIAHGPWLSPEPDTDPTTSSSGPDDPDTSGTTDPATAGDDGLVDHGCACAHMPGSPPVLLFAAILLRRRRR